MEEAAAKEIEGWRERNVSIPMDTAVARKMLRDGDAVFLRTHWVFVRKPTGIVKGRLVILGNRDPRVDTDNNVPVADAAAIRMVLTVFRTMFQSASSTSDEPDSEIWIDDMKQAYLQADICEGDEDVVVLIPALDGTPGEYEKLVKAAYGLQDSGRKWYSLLDGKLRVLGFRPLKAQPAVYMRKYPPGLIVTYVDDLLAMGPQIKAALDALDVPWGKMERFGVENPEILFAGMQLVFHGDSITVNTDYKMAVMNTMWNRTCPTPLPKPLGIEDDAALSTRRQQKQFRSILGSVAWTMATSRPDVSYATNFLSRSQATPTERSLVLADRLVAYIQQNRRSLELPMGNRITGLNVFSDASWGAAHDDHRCTWGLALFIEFDGNFPGTLVMWKTKLATRTAKSSMSAELSAAVYASEQALYVRDFLKELVNVRLVPRLWIDASCVSDAVNVRRRTLPRDKGLTLALQYLRELVNDDEIEIKKIDGSDQLADELTKPMSVSKLLNFMV